MNKEELIKQFDEKLQQLRDEFINKLEDDKKEFELTYPEDREKVYFVNSTDISVYDVYFYRTTINDKKVFEHGFCFNTKEEAEQHLKECKLLFKLHQWAKFKNEGWEPDWSDYSNNKFLIYYDGEDGLLRISAGRISNTLSTLPTLKTRKIAQECIDLFGNEIKEVLC